MTPQRSYKRGDYLLLYTTSSTYDWSCVLNENSVDSAVHNLTARVSEAINEAIPSLITNSSTFPRWFSSSLKHIKKKNRFFKTTTKADRLAWLTYIDENLKTQPKHFWKYISKFKKNDQAVTHLELGTKLLRSRNLLQKHLQTIFPQFLTFFSSRSSVLL
jgi:hypothetical protein